jgi:aerobic C4-dicarboxylate transport protein
MRKMQLYFWVLGAIFVGAATGFLWPEAGVALKPVGDGFIALIKMLIGPIIFCTVVTGIAGAGDMKRVGRVGLKALVYFEVVSTFALAIGLLVANVWRPGGGVHANLEELRAGSAQTSTYVQSAAQLSTSEFFLHLIPKTFVDAFTGGGDLIQVLLLAILFGYALTHSAKEPAATVLRFLEALSSVLFKMMNSIMYLAPLGAGAAMAFTVGRYGVQTLLPLAQLMGAFYLTCLLFVILVLGPIAWWTGFSIFRLIGHLREELLLVLGTSSSETALVPLMEKLENLGCPRAVVGLVIPAGYSFNLDGTNIYLTLAALFIAQAFGVELSLSQQLSLLLVAVVTSKGASAVTGAGFITLAATLTIVPQVPVEGLALILGVDRFMSEARALTNIVGNSVATLAVARWEGELDNTRLQVLKS